MPDLTIQDLTMTDGIIGSIRPSTLSLIRGCHGDGVG